MTSNAGSQTGGAPAGFGRTVSQQSRERAMKALEDIMRPEFLNRIDEIIAFNQLTEADFRRISVIMLGQLRDNLADKDIRLTWDDSLLDWLVEKSFSLKFGARNLRRLIEKEVENPLATADRHGRTAAQGRAPARRGRQAPHRHDLIQIAAGPSVRRQIFSLFSGNNPPPPCILRGVRTTRRGDTMEMILSQTQDDAARALCRRCDGEHRRAMYRAARALLSSDADAEDAVSEAILRAWQAFGRLRDEKCDSRAG